MKDNGKMDFYNNMSNIKLVSYENYIKSKQGQCSTHTL